MWRGYAQLKLKQTKDNELKSMSPDLNIKLEYVNRVTISFFSFSQKKNTFVQSLIKLEKHRIIHTSGFILKIFFT